jgi:hypothetical protein
MRRRERAEGRHDAGSTSEQKQKHRAVMNDTFGDLANYEHEASSYSRTDQEIEPRCPVQPGPTHSFRPARLPGRSMFLPSIRPPARSRKLGVVDCDELV